MSLGLIYLYLVILLMQETKLFPLRVSMSLYSCLKTTMASLHLSASSPR